MTIVEASTRDTLVACGWDRLENKANFWQSQTTPTLAFGPGHFFTLFYLHQ